ncbi:TetR/AcrR family transcriptional regulator [Nocardioidaceae bacterium SCSIO 66511]|nr:TetR/AcrR family transcriptional regulator [Nocardioidaceae bacterium SCSIO 66511]
MTTGTRDRIVASTAELLRDQGYAATGIKQIVERAGAPFGSIYHHFPGGKQQISAEAIRTSGAEYAGVLPLAFADAPDLTSGIRRYFELAAQHLEESDFADACPIATVALEVASTNEPLREATAEVFTSWQHVGTAYFVDRGVDAETAAELTTALVCGLEGAFVISRATRTTTALLTCGDVLARSFADRLPD